MLLTEHRLRYFVRRGSIIAAILGWLLSTQFAGRQLYGCVGVFVVVVDTCQEEVLMAVPKVGNPHRQSCPGSRGLGGRIEVPVSPIPVGSCAIKFLCHV